MLFLQDSNFNRAANRATVSVSSLRLSVRWPRLNCAFNLAVRGLQGQRYGPTFVINTRDFLMSCVSKTVIPTVRLSVRWGGDETIGVWPFF